MSLLNNLIGPTMQRFMWLCVMSVLCIGGIGCQGTPFNPQENPRTATGTHAEYGRFKVDVNADGVFIAEDVDAGSTGMFKRHFRARRIEAHPNTKEFWSGVHGAQDRYNTGNVIFAEKVLPAYAEAANGILDRTVVAALPLASAWIGGIQQAQMLKDQRPNVLIELVKALKTRAVGVGALDQIATIDPSLATQAANMAGVAYDLPKSNGAALPQPPGVLEIVEPSK